MESKINYDEDDLAVDFGDSELSTLIETEFLTGSAGTGKSYEINRRISENGNYGLVCATTGIAAINLGEGVTTVNAALGYFDTESLVDSYVQGWLTKRLRKIAKLGYRNIIIDEVSMMPAEQLDVIVKAMDEVSEMGLVLTGDFCQLPPVKARWAFEADTWPRFEGERTTKLTKCWRQSDENFLAALAAIRRGNGDEGVELLDKCNVAYFSNNALDFEGTTLVSKNDEVERFNWVCHSKLTTPSMSVRSFRWGKQKGEWKLIPESLELKIGAYVMILANKRQRRDDDLFGEDSCSDGFEYVNGDCGEVVGVDKASGVFTVKLKRDEREVKVTPITRRNEQKEKPTDESERTFFDDVKKRWVVGEMSYVPLRLAYASTVHKSQGLSLDAVQINLTNAFFGSPAMAYVALSRCRSAEGLRIIGDKATLSRRVKTDPKVQRFL